MTSYFTITQSLQSPRFTVRTWRTFPGQGFQVYLERGSSFYKSKSANQRDNFGAEVLGSDGILPDQPGPELGQSLSLDWEGFPKISYKQTFINNQW